VSAAEDATPISAAEAATLSMIFIPLRRW